MDNVDHAKEWVIFQALLMKIPYPAGRITMALKQVIIPEGSGRKIRDINKVFADDMSTSIQVLDIIFLLEKRRFQLQPIMEMFNY